MDIVHIRHIPHMGWNGKFRIEGWWPLYKNLAFSTLITNADKSKVMVNVRRELAQNFSSRQALTE